MAGCCKHGIDLSGSTMCGKCVECLTINKMCVRIQTATRQAMRVAYNVILSQVRVTIVAMKSCMICYEY